MRQKKLAFWQIAIYDTSLARQLFISQTFAAFALAGAVRVSYHKMRAMRLLDSQIASIRTIVPQYAGKGCRVYLFGSRLDDAARGGDVDLLIETPQQLPLMQRVRMKMAIEAALGLPVDLVVREENQTPTAFQRLAKLRSTLLMDEGA
jgi:predicted nucleotidyltransferase